MGKSKGPISPRHDSKLSHCHGYISHIIPFLVVVTIDVLLDHKKKVLLKDF